ncbi:MAG: N-acetyltransferase [Candidatus Zixiibacteriota bacterium]|nr:MAG: N-acetyltransferase [candidate division Zixibacteria bacterium]
MITLTTPRLVLRDFQPADLDDYRRLSAHPDFLRFYPEEQALPESVERLFNKFRGWAEEEPRRRVQLAITLPSGELLGSCGVRTTSEADREGSFGGELAADYRGRGYATEAGRALLEYGFRTLGLHRIYAETLVENRAAVRLAVRLGMQEEGVLRQNRWFRGRWWDTIILAVLEEEW